MAAPRGDASPTPRRPRTPRTRTAAVAEQLAGEYPVAICELDHQSPFQLLAATILSAQCTDVRVNMVTPALFARFPDAASLAAANVTEVEALVRSTGFFQTKARNLIAMSAALVDRFDGEVPTALEDLVTLAGVGRKTANVVLNTAFGEPTIAVDTHIFRVANRTGLAPGKTVRIVEDKLVKVVPEEFRLDAHHWLILHGRYTCKARKPDCPHCPIRDLCRWPDKTPSSGPTLLP